MLCGFQGFLEEGAAYLNSFVSNYREEKTYMSEAEKTHN